LTAIATCVDRWAVLSQSYKDLPQLNDTVLNMYLRAFDVLDREHIPSRIAAAGFALTRGDGAGAMKYIAPAWKAAPLDPEVMKMVAQIGIAQGGGQLEPAIIALRQAYPDSYFADVLEVIKLFNGQLLPQAAERAEVLAGKHPTRLEALGLRAAMGYLRGNERDLTVYLAKVDQLFSTRSDAHFLAATILDRAAQHDPAEALYKTALQRTPWLTDARHGLGDLYLNDGREDEARVVLDEAYRADPYNLSTVNYLRLLEEIAKYEKRETPHFILYFDPKADPIVADQIGPFMERCYDDLTKTFGFEPKQKVIVQIYPNDDEFSVRMAGVPGIENYGVSFGRVLATIAPRRGTKQGNFNWARVLRHELVHTINILQSKNRCPRWVTEGLAVWQEGVPFRFANVPPELYKRTMEGTLFRVRSFPLAFIAPKHPLDGEQAYTQGAYLAKYMVATYGSDSIVKLLNGYAQSMTDDEAFEHATGQPLTVMEDRWHAWMKTHLAAWNYDEATSKQVEALAKEGEQFIRAKAYGEALKVWQEAYDLQPTEVKPNQRLAFLYMQKDFQDLPKAIEHLKFLHVLELQNNRFAKQISRLYLRLDGLPNALKWAYEATYVDLYDASAHRLAADLYDKLNRSADAEAARQTANQIEVWDATRNKPAEQRNDEK
ncbi:MAG TPA: tetratricopeptide repeat protein, partial [Tepidisphaeraceae bacterium]